MVNDYITDFTDNNFGEKFGPYLSQNKINVLTPGKSPWIDLGDLPLTYKKYLSEDQQKFSVPVSNPPDSIILPVIGDCYNILNFTV